MATLYSTEITRGDQPRLAQTGVQVAKGEFTNTASLSVGDVIQMVQVPNRATIIDLYVTTEQETGASTFRVGDGVVIARYGNAASGGISALTRPTNAGVPFRLSLSDDVRFDTVDLTLLSQSAGSEYTLTTVVTYVADGSI